MIKLKCLMLCCLFTTIISAQQKLGFGLNTLYYDSTMLNIINSPKIFKTFAEQNHINFLRYPAGTESRTFFWDRPDLIPQAKQLYANYVKTNMPGKENKAKHTEITSVSSYAQVNSSAYENFLKFCNRSNIIPIIVLNIWFYHDDNKVYYTHLKGSMPDNTNWDQILQSIKKQVISSHKIISGPIYWEIGNEDNHIFSGKDYGEFVIRYSSAIKQLYPSDKILVTISNPRSKKIEEDWNNNMVDYLNNKKALNNIDYVAPHYYRGFSGEENDKKLAGSSNITRRFQEVNIYSLVSSFNTLLAKYPNIHIIFTEFGLFKKSSNPNFNTQLEGLLMFYYLMQFNASPKVDAVIKHGFTQMGSGSYYSSGSFKDLRYNFKATDEPGNGVFAYVTPKAKATSIFFDNNPVKADKLVNTNSYSYTVSNTSSAVIINVLNFSATTVSLNLNSIASNLSGKAGYAYNYQTTDLESKQWNLQKKALNLSSVIQLPAYSYCVITVKK